MAWKQDMEMVLELARSGRRYLDGHVPSQYAAALRRFSDAVESGRLTDEAFRDDGPISR